MDPVPPVIDGNPLEDSPLPEVADIAGHAGLTIAQGAHRAGPARALPAGIHSPALPPAASCPATAEGTRRRTHPCRRCRPRISPAAAREPGPGPARWHTWHRRAQASPLPPETTRSAPGACAVLWPASLLVAVTRSAH